MTLTFQTAAGQLLSVGDVARLEDVQGAQEIFRRNQRRIIQVTAQIQPHADSPRARAAVAEVLGAVALPAGLTARLAGEEEQERVQTVAQLKWAGLLALLLVLMVLAASFESLVHPLTVLTAIPVSLTGVALLLVPVGQPIGIMAMLGLIVLVGIAVNDAILLVDRAKQLQSCGMDVPTALVRAATQRLRPILMNTAINMVALVPLAIGAGESAQLRSPLALTVIGGLAASLVGSLTVVPCVYLVLEQWRERVALFTQSLRWRRA
jgi:HAE1 family hydrophobic/amphiphilic exporter-1